MRLEREGKYKESLIALMKYRELMREKGEKKDTVTTADMYSEMGEAFVRQSEYPEAEMYYTKEKNLRNALNIPSSDESFGKLYNNIGRLRQLQGRYPEALQTLEKALKINEKNDKRGVYLAQSYNNLGNVYFNQGKYDKAIEYHNKSLEIYKDRLGEDHPHTKRTMNNLNTCKRAKANA